MRNFKFFSVFLLLFLFKNLSAQISTSYYSSISFSKIGIGYEFSDKLWGDMRIYGGLTFQDFTIEPTIAYNYVSNENYDLYFGAGFSINYLTGPNFNIGIALKPFENKNLNIHIEAKPNFNIDTEELAFYSSFGIRYVLKKVNK